MGTFKRLALGYIAAAWIIVQILDVLGDSWGIPPAIVRGIHIAIAAGFLIALAYAAFRSRVRTAAQSAAARKSHSLPPLGGWLLAAFLIASLSFTIWSSNRTTWARTEALPEAQRLADLGQFAGALDLTEKAARHLDDDPAVEILLEQISDVIDITTAPDGADVYMKEYAADEQAWRLIGRTPIVDFRAPLGTKQWRLEKPGYETIIRVPMEPASIDVKLSEVGTWPDGMVMVPGGEFSGWTAETGLNLVVSLPDHYYDRLEVTNREFEEFVRAGGYQDEKFWRELEGRHEWPSAVTHFIDATGEPGPVNWEVGAPRSSEEDYPVSGVSWYEAAAYCRSVGKSLPTLYHWSGSSGVIFTAGDVAARSNFSAEGPMQGEDSQSVGAFGAFDLAGNVREWIWNGTENGRLILGGAWNGPEYFIGHAQAFGSMDRSAGNGFRCVIDIGETADREIVRGRVILNIRDYYSESPVSDDIFDVYRQQFAYDSAPLDARVERTGQTVGGFSYEIVSFSTPYPGSRMQALVMLPDDVSFPRQAVVVYPGSGAIHQRNVDIWARSERRGLNSLLRSGRAVVIPVLKSTFSRQDDLKTTWPAQTKRYTDYAIRWVQEVSRTLDYLETRPEIDAESFAYTGFSWGGRMGVIIMAVEDRFKVGMLLSGGLASGRSLPEVDQINFVTRVKKPILMLNGLRDSVEPYETAQKPLYEFLGTVGQDKRHVTFPDSGHNLPRTPLIRETLAWLDQHLGPTD